MIILRVRLWDSTGQQLIQDAPVKIYDCSATSAQIAKNLILSGMKLVEMFDDKEVRQSDIGHHFFLDQASLGKNRSEECCRLLNELAPSNRCPAMYNDEALDGSYFDGFDDCSGAWGWTAHICVRRLQREEDANTQHCWDFYVPTILVQTCGLVASIRLQIRELSGKSYPRWLMDSWCGVANLCFPSDRTHESIPLQITVSSILRKTSHPNPFRIPCRP